MWQLGLALLILAIGAAWLVRHRGVTLTAVALLANWLANTVIVRVSGEADIWGAFLATDYVTGAALLALAGLLCPRIPIGAAVITGSYALECVIHAAYGLSSQGPWPRYYYWWATFGVAGGQMLFVAVWGIYELAARRDRARSGLSPHRHVTAGRRAAAPPLEP